MYDNRFMPQAAMDLSYFLYNSDSEKTLTSTMVFFDKQGRRYESAIDRALIEMALEKVGGGERKAILRSSGGLVGALPYKLVVYQSIIQGMRHAPEIRVRLKFQDFLIDQGQFLNQERYQLLTKDIAPEKLVDPFIYNLKAPQRFVIDFGQGIIPVYVYDYLLGSYNRPLCLFVEWDMAQRLCKRGLRQRILVQPFRVQRGVLRVAYGNEHERALRNYYSLKKLGFQVIPDCLRFGNPFYLPSGVINHGELTDLFQQTIPPHYRVHRLDNVFGHMSGI